jgi:hypothetical protein
MKTTEQELTQKQLIDLLVQECRGMGATVTDLIILFWYLTPVTTLARLRRVVTVLRRWRERGLHTDTTPRPISAALLAAAIRKMHESPNFVPSKYEEGTLRYLAAIVATERDRAQQQPKPEMFPGRDAPPTGDAPDKAASNRRLKKLLTALQAVQGVDVEGIITQLTDLEHRLAGGQPVDLEKLLAVLDADLYVRVQQALPWAEIEGLRREVEGWYAEHKAQWSPAAWNEAVTLGIRERLWERYGIPILT